MRIKEQVTVGGRRLVFVGEFGKEVVHAVTDAITEIVADVAHSIQPGEKGILTVGGQSRHCGKGLLERMYQCAEIALVVVSELGTKAGSPLAIEHHQLCQAGGLAHCLFVKDNGLFGFGD